MKPFPGKVEMTKGKVHKRVLNDEQREWLCRWFPTIENKRLAKAMGISDYKLHEFARELGLTKSEAGLKAIRKRRDKAAARTNERNGCYDRKRGHPPSETTLEGNRKRWEETRQGLRECPMTMLKKHYPKKYMEAIKKKSHERRETIRKEKLRMMYGLDRKTRLKPVVLVPYKRSQTHHRNSALRRGYLLDVDCSEGSPGRYVIYYDDETQRSERFEQNCIKDGFRFEKDE
jgi:hypothetical protein